MENQIKGEARPINWSNSAKQAHLPPKSPLPSTGGAFLNYGPRPSKEQRNYPLRDRGCRQHRKTPSESFLIEEQPSWLEDLLNEPETHSSKVFHRRSASDSVALFEDLGTFPRVENTAQKKFDYCTRTSLPLRASLDFDRLHDEALRSILCEAESSKKQPISIEETSFDSGSVYKYGPNSPRQNHILVDIEPSSFLQDSEDCLLPTIAQIGTEEVDVFHKKGSQTQKADSTAGTYANPDMVPNQTKRQSAQRSRVRKLQYISDLERVVNVFQTQELDLSAEVAFLNQQHLMLAAENKVLKRRIAVLAQERFMKDSQHKSLKIEFQRLKLLYQHQQQRKSPLLLHYVPACADFDLQLLEFDKFSLGVESKPDLSEAVSRIV